MAYGTLGFGLLTGAFTESTTFVDWDWRSRGYAFGLPLFQREQLSTTWQRKVLSSYNHPRRASLSA